MALNSVVGIKTDLYNINQKVQQSDRYGLPQESVDSIFTSGAESFRVKCSFVNGFLSQIYFSDVTGVILSSHQKASYVETSKELLYNFEKYANNSDYGKFASMLNDIDSNKNTSLTSGDVFLKVNSYANASTFVWTYVDSNGIKADQKNVALSFENGQLIGFINNWQLYKVIGTPKLSADEATSLALDASKTFTYEATVDNKTETISGFSIDPKSLGHGALAYSNFYESNFARDGDPFSLYPLWYVPLGFDRFYPGDVSGMAVVIWADTGKVCGMQELMVDSNLGNSISDTKASELVSSTVTNQIISPSITILLILLVVTLFICSHYLKNLKIKRLFGKKAFPLFFSGLIIFSLFSSAIPQATANPLPYGKSRIYSCENTLNGYNNTEADTQEKIATAEICNYVGNLTQDNGYSTSNLHGTYTTVTSVVNNIDSDVQNYGHIALLHIGHYSEWGVAYQADNGDPIVDTAINDHTSSGTHSFVFLWVCTTASNPISANDKVDLYNETNPGVPIAWTHRDGTAGHQLMNFYGFSNPDYSGQCYISFYGFSPMVSGLPLYTFYGYQPTNCKEFLKDFYYYLVHDDLSVHAALDQASYDYFGQYLLDSPLSPNGGYYAWWPGGNNDPPLDHSGYFPIDFEGCGSTPNQMRVHGDSSMHLYQPTVTLSSNYGLSPTFYFDGAGVSTGNVNIWRDTYSISASVPIGYSFSHFTYGGNTFTGNPSGIPINNGGTLAVYYTPVPVAPSTPSVGGPSSGYVSQSYQFSAVSTDANGDNIRYTFNWGDGSSTTTGYYSSGSTAYASHTWTSAAQYSVTVTAQDSTGRSSGSSSPKSVTIQTQPPPSYTLTVSAYDDYTQQWLGPMVYIDGVPYSASWPVSVTAGYHTVAVETPYDYWVLSYFSDGLGNGASRLINSNTNIVAHYWI